MKSRQQLFLILLFACLNTVQLDVARAQTQQESDRRADFGSSLKTLKWDKKKQKALDTAPTQEAASKPGQKVSKPEEDDVLRLDTVMAVFDVLVLDAQGRPLTGFKQTDFIVNEDGQPQEIAAFSTGDGLSVPRSFVLIIDYSGSQLPYLRTSIEAAKTLVDKLAPKDRMAIVTDDVELVVEFTQDREQLKLALDSLKQRALSSRSLGQSAQLSALLATLRELVKEEERPIILFQTDGDELYRLHPIKEDSSRPGQQVREYSFEDVYQALAHSRTTLYTIIPGIQLLGVSAEEQMKRAAQMYENQLQAMDRIVPGVAGRSRPSSGASSDWLISNFGSRALRQQAAISGLAVLTGGWVEFLEKPEQAETIYARILRGINRRYVIGYYPTNATRDGKLRKVKIEVRGHPEYRVWGRKSYYAAEEK